MEDEVFSDVEGEEPYYPETERTYVTTTRSGRSVYAPRRLVVEEYEEVSSDSEGPSESSIDTRVGPRHGANLRYTKTSI